MTSTTTTKPSTKKPRCMAHEPWSSIPEQARSNTPSPVQALPPANAASKTSFVLEMLRRPQGATIDQMVTLTSWQPHTTRAVLTGLKKKGHAVSSKKADGVRVYRLAQVAAQ